MSTIQDSLKDLAISEWAGQPDVQGRLLAEIDSPPCWSRESWDDWTYSVPSELRDLWPRLTSETKLAVYLMATRAASRIIDSADRSEY